MKTNLIVYDIGSTYTKIVAFNRSDQMIEYIGRAQASTTVSDIEKGCLSARRALEDCGHIVVSDAQVLASSSAAGGLRMVAMGNMPRVTAKAAKVVAMSAGARVLEVITNEVPYDFRIEILKEIAPDIVLLAGGTDGGDREGVREHAHAVIESGIRSKVILAANKDAQKDVACIIEKSGLSVVRVENVMPTIHELRVEQARAAIHEQFIRQISRGKGLQKLTEVATDQVVRPTPGVVLMAAELIAKGTYTEPGIGSLLIVDVGGATTDIHSVQPELGKLSVEEVGLVVNNNMQVEYRTVEGNLGLRVSATGILEAVGAQAILSLYIDNDGFTDKDLHAYLKRLECDTAHIAQNRPEVQIDCALAIKAVEVALKRHAGYIAQQYDPLMGITPGTPVGRDLRRVCPVIALGGVFAHSKEDDRIRIMREAFKNPGISLLPNSPQFYFDEHYLMYAIGLLSAHYPNRTLRFAKSYFGF